MPTEKDTGDFFGHITLILHQFRIKPDILRVNEISVKAKGYKQQKSRL